jgi:hypothetical protein
MKIEVENAQQNEQVDWNKNPQLVIDKHGVIVKVLTSQTPSDDECFSGLPLNHNAFSVKHLNSWVKSQFKPFHGKITLSND